MYIFVYFVTALYFVCPLYFYLAVAAAEYKLPILSLKDDLNG